MIIIFIFTMMIIWFTFEKAVLLFGSVKSLQFMGKIAMFLFEFLKLHQSLFNNSLKLFLFVQPFNKFNILWIFLVIFILNIEILHNLFELLLIIFIIHPCRMSRYPVVMWPFLWLVILWIVKLSWTLLNFLCISLLNVRSV